MEYLMSIRKDIKMRLNDKELKIPPGKTGQFKTTCPFCSHRRKKSSEKCLSINKNENVWNCHHCGRSGIIVNQQKNQEVIRMNKVKRLESWKASSKDLSVEFINFFQRRGISKETLENNNIRMENIYMPAIDERVDAIAFPYIEEGNIVNIKYRDLDKNFRQKKGGKQTVFGLDNISEDETTLIIVEGEMDKLALDEAGLTNCVSVPNGAPSPNAKNIDNHLKYLMKCEETFRQIENIIIAVDDDQAGQKLESELARRLGYDKCSRTEFPIGCKDANDVLMNYETEKVKEVIDSAAPYPINGVFTVTDTKNKLLNIYKNGFRDAYSTGIDGLDDYYSVREQEFTIITGIPSHGKSELMDSIVLNLLKEQDWKIAIFSPENYPIERHHVKWIEKVLNKGYHDYSEEEISKCIDYLDNRIFSIAPKANALTIDLILSKTEALIYRHGIRGLVIDPFNSLYHKRPDGKNQTEYISSFLSKIRNFVREKDIHIWIVAHPRKMEKDESGNIKVPEAYDISGSANWFNKADNIISVFRNKDNTVDIHIQKIRFSEIGEKGEISIQYDKSIRNYKEAVTEITLIKKDERND
jgi:twinkle protein